MVAADEVADDCEGGNNDGSDVEEDGTIDKEDGDAVL